MTSPRLLIVLAAVAGAVAAPALADPPGRVGRIAVIDGGVSMLPPDADDWAWASRNFPVAPGESFWTGDDGRAQLQIGAADVRLDSQTELDVLDTRYGQMRLSEPQGSVDIRLWTRIRGGVTVATPAGDVHLEDQGLYRIDVGAPPEDGSYPPVEVTVFEGSAEAPGAYGGTPVYEGQAAVIYAGYDPEFQDAEFAAIDDWGRRLEQQARWRPYDDDPSAAIPGYGDLYAAGDFEDDPQYGRVWFPRDVPSDWAPYRYGHWAYVEPWGYTWIDDQPWGFAPFHYGRWAQIYGRWAWVPGRQTAEPVYAPALVAFLGGVGWRVGGSEAVGWAPLAPGEVFRPSYRVGDDYVRRVNVTSVNTTIINNITVNNIDRYAPTPGAWRNAPAATVIRADAFAGAQPVRRAALPVNAAALAQAPVLASLAATPRPTPLARMGLAVRPDAAGRLQPPVLPAAARPPAPLAAIRSAVAAAPPGSARPPVIPGVRVAPPPAQIPAAGRPAAPLGPVIVAPSQLRAQGLSPAAGAARAPVAPPAAGGPWSRPQPAGPLGRPPMAQPPMAQPPVGQRPMAQPPLAQPPMARPPMGAGPVARPPGQIYERPGTQMTAPPMATRPVPASPAWQPPARPGPAPVVRQPGPPGAPPPAQPSPDAAREAEMRRVQVQQAQQARAQAEAQAAARAQAEAQARAAAQAEAAQAQAAAAARARAQADAVRAAQQRSASPVPAPPGAAPRYAPPSAPQAAPKPAAGTPAPPAHPRGPLDRERPSNAAPE